MHGECQYYSSTCFEVLKGEGVGAQCASPSRTQRRERREIEVFNPQRARELVGISKAQCARCDELRLFCFIC